MKTWDQLTRNQQVIAMGTTMGLLIAHVYEGIIEVTMSKKLSQLQLGRMISNARKHNDVFLLKTLIEDNKEVQAEFERIVLAACEGSNYLDNGNVLMDKQ